MKRPTTKTLTMEGRRQMKRWSQDIDKGHERAKSRRWRGDDEGEVGDRIQTNLETTNGGEQGNTRGDQDENYSEISRECLI